MVLKMILARKEIKMCGIEESVEDARIIKGRILNVSGKLSFVQEKEVLNPEDFHAERISKILKEIKAQTSWVSDSSGYSTEKENAKNFMDVITSQGNYFGAVIVDSGDVNSFVKELLAEGILRKIEIILALPGGELFHPIEEAIEWVRYK